MPRLIAFIDTLNARVAAAVLWLAVAMVVVQLAIVVLRYVFAVGFLSLQESMWYMNGALFMLGAGYALSRDQHVRIDVFYAQWPAARRALVDFLGAVFFVLPLAVAIVWLSWGYVTKSWVLLEGSRDASGLPLIFLLKSVIWIFAALLGLQGLALACRAGLVLFGSGTDYSAGAKERFPDGLE